MKMNFKTFASTKGLVLSRKKAYGNYQNYMITVNDNGKVKTLCCSAIIDGDEAIAEVERFILMQKNAGRKITGYGVTDKCLVVHFAASSQTFDQMGAFLDALIAKLSEVGAQGMGICPHCKQPILADGQLVQINGIVVQMHGACVRQHNEQVDAEQTEIKSDGNVFTGAIGAVLGGILGCIPWAVAYYFGWFVGWLGFLIGLAAKKGYELLNGKRCKTKGIIIIAVTVLCVILAEFVTVGISLALDPEFGVSVIEGILWVFEMFFESDEVRGAVLSDVALGLLFAGLGIFSLAKDIFSDASPNNDRALPL